MNGFSTLTEDVELSILQSKHLEDINEPFKNSYKCTQQKCAVFSRLFWFCWHTFDFITDIMVGIQWCSIGFETSQHETLHACSSIRSISSQIEVMNNFGIALFAFSGIGYVISLYTLGAEIGVCQDKEFCFDQSRTPNYPKIFKIYLEDFVSILITVMIAIVYSEITGWIIASLIISTLSFIFALGYAGVHKTYKGNCITCCVFNVCFILTVIPGIMYLFIPFVSHVGLTDASMSRVITINNRCEVLSYGGGVDVSVDSTSISRYYQDGSNKGLYCRTYFLALNRTVCSNTPSYLFWSNIEHTDSLFWSNIVGTVKYQSCGIMIVPQYDEYDCNDTNWTGINFNDTNWTGINFNDTDCNGTYLTGTIHQLVCYDSLTKFYDLDWW
eukprot:527209_1